MYGMQYNGRCSKCCRYCHKPTGLKSPENKKEKRNMIIREKNLSTKKEVTLPYIFIVVRKDTKLQLVSKEKQKKK